MSEDVAEDDEAGGECEEEQDDGNDEAEADEDDEVGSDDTDDGSGESEPAGPPPVTKAVIMLHGGHVTIGVQRDDTDAYLEHVAAETVAEGAEHVGNVIEAAERNWAENPKYKRFDMPRSKPAASNRPKKSGGKKNDRQAKPDDDAPKASGTQRASSREKEEGKALTLF